MVICKCPKCDKNFNEVLKPHCYPIETQSFGSSVAIKAIAFACPSCHACLGMMADPVAMVADTAARVKKVLGK